MKQHLEAVGNEELLLALKAIVGKERVVMCEWLAHLSEVEARRLHEGLGFQSIWMFCTQALGLCETTAARRIAAARVCRKYPQAFELVASGTLQLTVLSLLQPHLNAENADELFALCSGTSFRNAERAVATRFPKPDYNDSIRRLPAARPGTPNVESSLPRLVPLSEERFGVRFTASAEFRDLLVRVRALASHRLPGGDLETLLRRGLEAYERELLKRRFAVGKNSGSPKRARASREVEQGGTAAAECARASVAKSARKRAASSSRNRNISALVRREVYERDGGRCTFISEDGRHCDARHFLQYDHIVPHALGGPPTTQNLRLRCGAHNRWAERLYFHKARARVHSQG